MSQIYLDHRQCVQFEINYTMAGRLLCEAREVLESKGGDGYDTDHHAILEPLGDQEIVLVREQNDNPGWFNLVMPDEETDEPERHEMDDAAFCADLAKRLWNVASPYVDQSDAERLAEIAKNISRHEAEDYDRSQS